LLIIKIECIISIASLKFGTGHNSTDALDYFHINSVDRDEDHNYLVSGRHTSTIYKINGTSGDIIWRLGGKNSDFTLTSGVNFGLQHDARFISRSKERDIETISIFDNSGSQINGSTGEYINKSSGKLLLLNTKTWTATLIQEFSAPDEIFAFSQGGTRFLPNGNVFVNWGSAGAVTEFSPNGTVIFHAYLDSGDLWKNGDVQNYRGFRFNWTGIPNEQPAVTALTHGESTMVYVSWNGDTETRIWEFYGIDSVGKIVLLGKELRDGFETSFYVHSGGDWQSFFTKAIGEDGKVLRKSEIVLVKPYIYPYVPGRDDMFFGDASQFILENYRER
jgi:Arylsulfotransferase (ASST)